MNNIKTAGLLAFLTVFVVLVATWIGFNPWMALIFAGVFNALMYFFSDRMALASARARPVTEAELPEVYGTVRRLTMKTEMPMPSIHVIDSPQPNAFATGRSPNKAAVAVTTGILDILTAEELEGVLGHELAHVEEPGHPDQFHRRHARRGHCHARPDRFSGSEAGGETTRLESLVPW